MPSPTPNPSSTPVPRVGPSPVPAPTDIDLKKDRGLTLRWADGTTSYYPIAYLRRMSPSADMRQLRDEMASNPLTVLPSRPTSGSGSGPIVATGAELVGNYALRITFSDGHSTGIYSWVYLRSIDPDRARVDPPPS